MNGKPSRLLLIQPNDQTAERAARALAASADRFDVTRAIDLAEGMHRLTSLEFDIVLLAIHSLDNAEKSSLHRVCQAAPHLPVVVTVHDDNSSLAVQALQHGAQDYLFESHFGSELSARTLRNSIARKATELALDVSQRLLHLTYEHTAVQPLLEAYTDVLKEYVGCSSVGVRVLDDSGLLPYRVHVGFSPTFLDAERGLSTHESDCMCVELLKPAKNGDRRSFSTNRLSEYLAEAGHQSSPTAFGACRNEGFESLALIPIRFHESILGLIHLADTAPDRFAPERLRLIEETSVQLAVSVGRLRAQQGLRDSEAWYRTLVETSPDAITLTDLEGKVLRSNRRGAQMYGLESAEEMIGMDALEFIADADKERAAENMKKVLETGAVRTIEYTLLRRDGTRYAAELNASLVTDASGSPSAFVGVVRDVTERKQMQTRLAQTDRLASVGMLAAGVAHEINNPLTYVLYNLELLAKRLPDLAARPAPLDSQEVQRLAQCASEAVSGALRVRDIVRDLKGFSRVREDQVRLVQINLALETAANMAFNEIKYRARLVRDYGEVPSVSAHESRLTQVFVNLLVNAAQSIEVGNAEQHEIRLCSRRDGDEVIVEVSDTGCGITDEDLAHIFDPFFTTKGVGSGSGLGLSISHNIISAYGGSIGATSTLGKGSLFAVRLPIGSQAVTDSTRPPPSHLAERRVARPRILVIDDEPLVRKTIWRALKLDHDIVQAASGIEALAILEKDAAFDVVLCDLMMPSVSGLSVYRWLEAQRPELIERFVLMTGGAFTRDAADFLEDVAPRQVAKPFEAEELRSVVRGVVRCSGDEHGDEG